VCVGALGLLLLLAAPTIASTYFGATISGETYGQEGHAPKNQAAWDLFERHAGRKVAILNQGQRWATFDKAAMDATRARGAIPMVTMGLETGMTLADVVNGSQDAAIEKWAQDAKAWGQPFFLSLWWEMNGNWYAWGRSLEFVAAWQRFHKLVTGEGATNVTFTWTVNSIWSADPASDPSPYYPGDAYVDWLGLDSYNWGRSPVQPDKWTTPEQTLTPTLDVLEGIAPTKPVVIVENASTEYGGNKANWIREMLTSYLPHHPEVKAYLWFNWDFPKNGLRSDWPIESSAPAQLQFREAIQGSVFVSGPTSLPPLTKVPPPGAAAADPAQPADVSPAAEMAGEPDVAVGDDGTATVAWSARGGGQFNVFARRIAADGTWGPVQQLSASGQDALAPQVAVAPDGTATVVWIRSNGSDFQVQARRIDPAGSPEEATRTLSGSGQDAEAPQVDVAPDGTATVVWQRFNGSHYLVQARRIDPDGTSEAPAQTLSETKQSAVEPLVAVAPDGIATVAWSRFDGTDSIVQERRVEADGTLGATTANLSTGGESAVQPRVEVAEDGAATVIWTRFDGADWIVQARRLTAGGVPQGVVDLSAAGDSAAEPELAVDPDGSAVVVWTRLQGGGSVVQARRLDSIAAPIGAATTLSAAGDAADPRLALAPDGEATVLWSGFNGSHWVVQRRDLDPSGTVGSVLSLSTAGRSAGDAALAWGSDGTLAMVWRRASGSGDVVQAGTVPKPQPPPPPPPLTSSGAGSPSGDQPRADDGTFVSLFQVGRPRLNRKRGTATLTVAVPGPGELTLRGATPQRRAVAGAGTVTLRVVPKAAHRVALRKRGSLRLKLTVTFEPVGGAASSRSLTLRLKQS
jgi:hypothetical protein